MGRWELWGWGRMGYQKVLNLLCLAALPGGLECGGMRRGRGLSWLHPIFCQNLSILYGYIMVIAQYDAVYCVPRDRNFIATLYLFINTNTNIKPKNVHLQANLPYHQSASLPHSFPDSTFYSPLLYLPPYHQYSLAPWQICESPGRPTFTLIHDMIPHSPT